MNKNTLENYRFSFVIYGSVQFRKLSLTLRHIGICKFCRLVCALANRTGKKVQTTFVMVGPLRLFRLHRCWVVAVDQERNRNFYACRETCDVSATAKLLSELLQCDFSLVSTSFRRNRTALVRSVTHFRFSGRFLSTIEIRRVFL